LQCLQEIAAIESKNVDPKYVNPNHGSTLLHRVLVHYVLA